MCSLIQDQVFSRNMNVPKVKKVQYLYVSSNLLTLGSSFICASTLTGTGLWDLYFQIPVLSWKRTNHQNYFLHALIVCTNKTAV